jgi:hypothetical protein
MRVAAGSAWEAARPIARSVWRVDMACKSPSSSTVNVAEPGKVRVNRISEALLLAEAGRTNQAAR